MKIATRIVLAALAGATTLTGLAATPAAARATVSIEYHDGYYGDRYYGDRYRDRSWRERERWERRHAYYRGYRDAYRGYDRGGYRDYRRCWTEWRRDRWGNRDAIRVCR